MSFLYESMLLAGNQKNVYLSYNVFSFSRQYHLFPWNKTVALGLLVLYCILFLHYLNQLFLSVMLMLLFSQKIKTVFMLRSTISENYNENIKRKMEMQHPATKQSTTK